MKKKLKVQSLIKKYPKIFRQSKLPMTQTCMCWGIETDEGWYDLLDSLCSQLQWDIDRNRYPQIEAVQVKEKFGTLRFYTSGKEGEFDRLVKSGEISQKELIIQASSRQKYIDQGQSLNLMIHPKTDPKEVNKLLIFAWESNIKSLYYQRSTNPAQELGRSLLDCKSCEA